MSDRFHAYILVLCLWLAIIAFIFLLGLIEYFWIMKRRRAGKPFVVGIDLAKGKDFSVTQAYKRREGGDSHGR